MSFGGWATVIAGICFYTGCNVGVVLGFFFRVDRRDAPPLDKRGAC